MTRLTASLAGLALALGALGARAQTPTPDAPPPVQAASGAMSVETTSIGDLLADPAAKAVMEKDMPKLEAYPRLDDIKGMTLRDISVYPEAELDDTKLAVIQKDLNAAKR